MVEIGLIKRIGEIRPLIKSLTTTLSASSWYKPGEIYVKAPVDCKLETAFIYFPPGNENLVEIRLGIRNQEFLTDWITSGDSKSLTLPFKEELEEGEHIWVEAKNLDTTNTHTPTIEVSLTPIQLTKRL